MTVNSGFSQAPAALYRMVFTAVMYSEGTGDGFCMEDTVNGEAGAQAMPSVEVWTAAGVEPTGRVLNPLRAATHNGKDIMAWGEAIRLLTACNADATQLGTPAKGCNGAPIRPVAMRVGALEGRGQWPARNVLRAWHPTMDTFKMENATAAAALSAAMDAQRTRGPEVGGNPLAAAQGIPSRAGQTQTTQAAPTAPPTAPPPRRKRRTAAEMAADAEAKGAQAAEDIKGTQS